MSAGVVIIAVKRGLLKEFNDHLVENGFATEYSGNSICVSEPVKKQDVEFVDNIFIDDAEEVEIDQGFDLSDIELYQRMLNDFESPLVFYYIKYHSRSFVIKVLLSITKRSDIVIFDDRALVVRGDHFAAQVDEFK